MQLGGKEWDWRVPEKRGGEGTPLEVPKVTVPEKPENDWPKGRTRRSQKSKFPDQVDGRKQGYFSLGQKGKGRGFE